MNTPDGNSAGTAFATFRVGEHLCCVDVGEIQEIVPLRKISPVPLAPDEILGLMNLRGRILTIIDLASILELKDDGDHREGMILVLDASRGNLGLRVDSSSDVLRLREKDFEETPKTLQGEIRRKIRGAYKLKDSLLLHLNLDELGVLTGRKTGREGDASTDH
jgi:purine-binding chemotaxis protein CheW